jgi:hypothetical protein
MRYFVITDENGQEKEQQFNQHRAADIAFEQAIKRRVFSVDLWVMSDCEDIEPKILRSWER